VNQFVFFRKISNILLKIFIFDNILDISEYIPNIHMTLKWAIDPPPLTITADVLAADAIFLLKQEKLGCLLVVESQKLVGIFTQQDAIDMMASAQNWDGVAIAQVMHREVTTLNDMDPIDPFALLRLLNQRGINFLPVVTEQNHVVGLVTQTTLFDFLQEKIVVQQTQLQDVHKQLSESISQRKQIEIRTTELERTNTQLTQALNNSQHLKEQLQANEQALDLNQERLESILGSIEDVVWSIAPHTFQLLYINTATEKVYGRSISEFIQNLNLWEEMIHPEDRAWVIQSHQILYTSGKNDLEYRILWPDGQVRWISARSWLVTNPDGVPVRIDGTTTDITTQRLIQEQLRHDALHDGLTGLANRSLLKDRIEQSLKRNQRQEDKLFAILFLDLDRFKIINDSLGHQVGDQLLIAVAERLQTCQRAEDTVARLGGDEFVILLEDLDCVNDAIKIAQRIHQSLIPPIVLAEREVFVTASIGIAFGNSKADTQLDWVSELLRDADTAMYRAKARGQGCHEVFNPSMHAAALKQMEIETELRRTLVAVGSCPLDLYPSEHFSHDIPVEEHRSEFQVYYQPIISLLTHRIEGFEALVRWQHPQKGLISPVDFIPIAEETEIIINIDRWVLKNACRQLRLWQDQFPKLLPLSISVNLSSKHFAQSGLIEFLDQVFTETGLKGSALKIEITETCVIKNPETATIILKELKARNIQVCLDDFGTGYSSLSYLHAYPFNTLKIDRSFIQQMGEGTTWGENAEIVRAIINLGANLGMSVVAEGVETQAQVAQLQALHCQYGQGYWFAQPMSSSAAATFLLESQFSDQDNAQIMR
jgi:diguanylate cyclase (GGDEF)-like protein